MLSEISKTKRLLQDKAEGLNGRPTREDAQGTLFEVEPAWREHWFGMPEFEMKDATPQYRFVVNFMTWEDVQKFQKKLGVKHISRKTDSIWYPSQGTLKGEFEYDGPKTDSRYPICIPSKGRADCQKTGHALDRMGVSYKFFVEETEGDEYIEHLGVDKVVVMPFHDLGQGSVPARNYIWEYCFERGCNRHWTVDDNISHFIRMHNNRRLIVRGGGFFNAMEDFVDRYKNVAMAGPHNRGFLKDRKPNIPVFLFNSRVYSCILLDTTLPHRWRGRYNEDTDLSLRLLKDGYCTLLFHALCMDKGGTNYGDGRKGGLKGGNTDNVYNGNDYRLAFAESLRDQHPDVVKVVWKFNRWHHQVDYSMFKKNKPIFRDDVVRTKAVNNYSMELVRVKI